MGRAGHGAGQSEAPEEELGASVQGAPFGAQLAGRASRSSAERRLLHHNLVPEAQAQGPGQHSLTGGGSQGLGTDPGGQPGAPPGQFN